MRRIAHREMRRHGKALHLGAKRRHPCLQRRKIQRRNLIAGMAMPARQPQHRIAPQRLGQPGPLQIARRQNR